MDIPKIVKTYVDAAERMDLERWIDTFAPDGTYSDPLTAEPISPQQLKQHFAGLLGGAWLRVHRSSRRQSASSRRLLRSPDVAGSVGLGAEPKTSRPTPVASIQSGLATPLAELARLLESLVTALLGRG